MADAAKSGNPMGAIGSLLAQVAASVNQNGQISVTDLLSGNAARRVKMAEMQAQYQQMQMEDIAARQQKEAAEAALAPVLQGNAAQMTGADPSLLGGLDNDAYRKLITGAIGNKQQFENSAALMYERDRLQDENRGDTQRFQAGENAKQRGFQAGQQANQQAFTRSQFDYEQNAKAPSMGVVGAVMPGLDQNQELAPADREALFGLGQKGYESKLKLREERKKAGIAFKAKKKEGTVAAAVTTEFLTEGLKNGMINPDTPLGRKVQTALSTGGPLHAKQAMLDKLYTEVLEGGANKITPAMASKIQENIYTGAKVQVNLDQLAKMHQADPEMLTYLTQAEKATKGWKSRLTGEEYNAKLEQAEQFSSLLNDGFNTYVQSRTGAAMGVTEIERYRDAFVAPTNSPAVFAARIKALQAAYDAAAAMEHSILNSGSMDAETMAMAREEAKKINAKLGADLEAANAMEGEGDIDSLSDEEAIKRAKEKGLIK